MSDNYYQPIWNWEEDLKNVDNIDPVRHEGYRKTLLDARSRQRMKQKWMSKPGFLTLIANVIADTPLDPITTKGLYFYIRRGIDGSQQLADFYQTVARDDRIPYNYKVPFTLRMYNAVMNGAWLPGQEGGGSSAEHFRYLAAHPDMLYDTYTHVRKSTLERWRKAVTHIENWRTEFPHMQEW